MNFALTPSSALAILGAIPSPYALVERWYEPSVEATSEGPVSEERRILRKSAREAMFHARSVAFPDTAVANSEEGGLTAPPLLVTQRVQAIFRRVAPLVPPTIDEDDLPL